MDIWTAPVGAELDLGEPPSHPPDGLGQAGVVLDRVARRLAGPAKLAGLTWHEPPTDTGRLSLTLTERVDGRTALLRLYSLDPAGNPTLLADIRCRQGATLPPRPTDLLAKPVAVGDWHETTFVVSAELVTGHVPGREPVLSTPSLVGRLEDVAADILRARFAPHASSVGTWIGVRHTGSATLDDTVHVSARVADVRGRRVLFDVQANVDGRSIGDGQVAQTIIQSG